MSGGPLIEILVAAALVGGPLLCGVQLVQSSRRAVQVGVERAVAGAALADLAERLVDVPPQELAAVAAGDAAARAAWLDARLTEGLERLPEAVARIERAQKASLGGRLDLSVAAVAGVPGLVRITVSAQVADGNRLRLARLRRTSS